MTLERNKLESEEASLVQAIRQHRVIIENSADDAVAVMAAINELHGAILAYADQVMEISGWGNPFIGFNDAADDIGDDRDSDVPASAVDDAECENEDEG